MNFKSEINDNIINNNSRIANLPLCGQEKQNIVADSTRADAVSVLSSDDWLVIVINYLLSIKRMKNKY